MTWAGRALFSNEDLSMAVAEPVQTQNRALARWAWLDVQVRSVRASESPEPENVGATILIAVLPVASPEFRWKSIVQAMSRLVLKASCWMPQVGVSPTIKRSKSSCGGGGRPAAGGLRSIRKRMVP